MKEAVVAAPIGRGDARSQAPETQESAGPEWIQRLQSTAEGLLFGSVSVTFQNGIPKKIERHDTVLL